MDIRTHANNTREGENVQSWVESEIKAPLPLSLPPSVWGMVWHYDTSPLGSSSGSPGRWPRVYCNNPCTWTLIQSVHKDLANIYSDSICWTISACSFSPKLFSIKQDFTEGPDQQLCRCSSSYLTRTWQLQILASVYQAIGVNRGKEAGNDIWRRPGTCACKSLSYTGYQLEPDLGLLVDHFFRKQTTKGPMVHVPLHTSNQTVLLPTIPWGMGQNLASGFCKRSAGAKGNRKESEMGICSICLKNVPRIQYLAMTLRIRPTQRKKYLMGT